MQTAPRRTEMADRKDEPTDLFDAMCRLDDLADWLDAKDYADAVGLIRQASDDLKQYIVLVRTVT